MRYLFRKIFCIAKYNTHFCSAEMITHIDLLLAL
nr:MAG TPA: hypothetical protein [Caudoviricetes sp.]